eukprot:TRINITY_DN83683_c0_g1_i1.p1 TRINITY_DN83683_c0_g1~~TRINITY_DN83683_c0_g1_i1.p1  ORF type:complete len:166 (+),score=43.40 TRINITY_DN83683_c0_g1_i1:128-625(+)
MATVSSLEEFVEKGQLECLNEDKAFPVANILQPNKDLYLASDPGTDHQLLVKVQFRVPVKLQSIRILGCSEDETAPQIVKIFQDKVNMGFEDAEEEAVQELNITPKNVDEGELIQLRFVKFQNVTSLQLFFQENMGADQTKVAGIEFFGQPAASMDMKDWKPVKG